MKIEKLTPEQEAMMPVIAKKWIDRFESGKSDKEKIREGVEWLYHFSGLKKPVVWFVNSPMMAQIMAIFLTSKESNKNVLANVWANVWANVGANVRENVRENVRANVGAKWFDFSTYGNYSDYGWLSFYDFFQSVCGLGYNNDGFDKFKKLIFSGLYDSIQLDGLCIAITLPSFICRDANGRLHNASRPAIQFNDGYFENYIHGVFINPVNFERIQKGEYTFEDWAKEENEEVKTAVLSMIEELMGNNAMCEFLSGHLKKIDEYRDVKPEKYLNGTTGGMNIGVYTLFKGIVGETEIAFVRCYCPSSDRMFYLGVSPDNNNAKDAIASLYRVPEKLSGHIKYIQRQGERFSTVFTENGKEVLKGMSEQEIKNLVPISGDNYFKLMTYEY